MVALLQFIAWLIQLYIYVVFASVILNWLIFFNVVNRHNQVVYSIADTLNRLTEPALRPIRNALPDFGGVDLSPLVLIIGLIFIQWVVIGGWLIPLFV